jgi:hypothetical protein
MKLLGGGRPKPVPPEQKSRDQLIHEAECWRAIAGHWRGECFEHIRERDMLRHHLERSVWMFCLFWACALGFCVAVWWGVIELVRWLVG